MMKVIGAGFGRTGTLSLKHALEQLGIAPCYHMNEVMGNPDHIKRWQAIVDGKSADWDAILGNYQAGVDVPVSLYYAELLAHYPDAKILLSVRDPERWYESMIATVFQFTKLPRWMRYIPRLGAFLRLADSMIWSGFFDDRLEDRAYAIAKFNAHNERVKQVIPPEKLLVYSVKEGWEPLCRFLDVPVPTTPFPHLNDRVSMQARLNTIRMIGRIIPLVGGATLLIVGLILKRLRDSR